VSSGEGPHAVGIEAPASASAASEAAGVSEDVDLAKLRWRSRRGLLELDLWLGRFVQRQLSALTPTECGQYEALLALPDPDLLDMLNGRASPLPGLAALIRRIQQI
jgi:antitoxin CptB